jgi:uncharacterized protein (DUF1015 family)
MNNAGHAEDPGAGPVRHGLDLIPFRGVRYVPERVSSIAAVTSPPYDVVVRPDGLRHLQSADPCNIVRLILPQSTASTTHTEQAAATLQLWLDSGVLATDEKPGFYVYEQQAGDLLQRGVIGALGLSGAAQGIVLPHEDVMPQIVAERADLMRATAANLEPLLLTYRGDPDSGAEGGPGDTGAAAVIERTVQRRPLLTTTTEDGIRHRLWAVTAPEEITEVRTDLLHHRALIADGHHRWATYLRLCADHTSPGPWDFGLVLLVDSARYPLRVRAIHRLLHRLAVPDAVAAVADSFRVRTVEGSLDHALEVLTEAHTDGNAFLLTGDGTFRVVDRPSPGLLDRVLPADRPQAWRTLDATVLHAVLLDHIWQIPDTPEHIAYIHDATATVTKAEREGGTAVLMRPVREDVVRDLAQQGVMMPRKSTSFGPKPATGLVLRRLV